MGDTGEPREYLVPCYRASADDPWFHFLHGDVPGHQIDFMYRPEVPQGLLGRQHYSHLARLMGTIEPRGSDGYAFAIGNLSRDDTQHEPGHGGVALIFGLRVRGATDHAGRPDPPFAHAVAVIDRALDAPVLFEAAAAFQRRVLDDAASAAWYRSYVRSAAEAPAETVGVLAGYVAGFGALPRPGPSALSLAWTTHGAARGGRVAFVYPDDAPFEVLARAASRLAAVLYRSNVRWSAISSGREADLPNGLTVRFLPESAVGRGDAAAALHPIDAIPDEDEAIARELFGASPVRARLVVPGWRDRPAVIEAAPTSSEREIPVVVEAPVSAPAADLTPIEAALIEAAEAASPAPMVPIPVPLPLVEPPPLVTASDPPPPQRRSSTRTVAAAACVLAGVLAMVYGVFAGGQVSHAPHTDTAPRAEVATAPVSAPADAPVAAAVATAAAPEGTVADVVSVVAPLPAGDAKVAVKPARPGKRAPGRSARCGDLHGRPCF